MNASDLITQVHSEEDENGHDHSDHLHDHEQTSPGFWQKFLGCLLCKTKSPSSPHAHSSNINKPYNQKQAAVAMHQTSLTQTNATNSTSANATNSLPSSAATKTNQHNAPPLPAPPASSLPLTQPTVSSPVVALQSNGAPPSKFLLPPLSKEEVVSNKKTLVLDLDETLVHSSFKPIPNADFVLSIDLDGVIHRVYVRKRPGVDHFLRYCAEKFEVVVFTASLAKYADPLLDILDRERTVKVRLFREACVQHYGNYVKDLTHLGRRLENTIIVDNSPFSYMFQPENAIPITSWFNDKTDRQLYDLLPHLDHMADSADVVQMLAQKKLQFNNGTVTLGQ